MKILTQIFYGSLIVMTLFWSCDSDPETVDTEIPTEEISRSGNVDIDGLTQKIAATPDDPALYAARAAFWWQNEGFDEAITDLEQALSLDSTNVEYYHVLSDFYLEYYKSRKALLTIEKAANMYPRGIPTWLKLAEFQLILKQHENALFSLEHIRTIDPQNAEMFFMFGTVFKDMDKIDQALNAFQSAVEQEPDLIDAWINLGQLFAQKENKIALKYFDNALRVDSNNIEAIKAKAYYLANDLDDLTEAVRLYKRINVIAPQYEEGYYDIGLLYMDMDSLELAWKSFDLAIKNEPTFLNAYYFRGIASEKRGNVAAAISDFKQILNLDPDFDAAKDALAKLEE
ncbi:tetratricopeptide repeat protein [Saprospiraceae bacterium]|jgi:tetratricopeptide (TPR) repeat protein|nr:tetratricopeptide repeat protein [Bacteroidota bacterium]MDB4728211.1 tetratricopeptide repeat protein [Saprospiraceae bacterium]MDF1864304.1 tetratricopeptide repeat protein [Saprospiraceae bacterium]